MLRPAHTAAITGPGGEVLEGSIAELTGLEVDGHDLGLMVRGHDVDNPVMLFLAGGPGDSALGAMRRHCPTSNSTSPSSPATPAVTTSPRIWSTSDHRYVDMLNHEVGLGYPDVSRYDHSQNPEGEGGWSENSIVEEYTLTEPTARRTGTEDDPSTTPTRWRRAGWPAASVWLRRPGRTRRGHRGHHRAWNHSGRGHPLPCPVHRDATLLAPGPASAMVQSGGGPAHDVRSDDTRPWV